jgi:hypothetical protein
MDHQALAQLLGNYGEFMGSLAICAAPGGVRRPASGVRRPASGVRRPASGVRKGILA